MEPCRSQSSDGVIVPFGGEATRLLEAVRGRVSRLAGPGVLARCLAQIFRVALDVEDVVDNLERNPRCRPYSTTASIAASSPPP